MFDLIGKPFVDGGRGPDGFDCWGLVMEIYRRFGVQVPDFAIAACDTEKVGGEIARQRGLCVEGLNNWQEIERPAAPCLVLLQNSPTMVNHCAVYIGIGCMMHVMKKTGVHMDRLAHPLWRKRIRGFFKYGRELDRITRRRPDGAMPRQAG